MSFFDRFKKDKRVQTAPKSASKFFAGKKSEEAESKKEKEFAVEKKETAGFVAGKKSVTDKKIGENYRVLLRPLISEKAAVAESKGVYTFMVARQANKRQIKQAIVEAYKIKPKKIRVINREGKTVRHGRSSGRRNDWKKAIVTLPKGQMINIHEGV